MKKDLEKFVVEKTHDLLKAPSACPEVKAAANAWLKAVGTKDEAAETKKYLKENPEVLAEIEAKVRQKVNHIDDEPKEAAQTTES